MSRKRNCTRKTMGLLQQRKSTSKSVGRLQYERICGVFIALFVLLREKIENGLEMPLL